MKNISLIIFTGAFLFTTLNLFSQTREETFETYWEGRSESVTDVTDSGYFVCSESMYSVDYDEDYDTFSAIIKTVFALDGEEYESRSSVRGSYNEDTQEVIIRHESTIYQETLPYGMYWIDSDLYLHVYIDEECDGYFYLFGQTSSQSLDDEFYGLSNCPY